MSNPRAKKKQSARNRELVPIGWREYVALPEWGIAGVRAKADSGARSSAIDVHELEELPDGRARFLVVVDRETKAVQEVTAEVVRRSRVRSSFGGSRHRLFVRTTIQIGSHRVEAEIGLVNRKRMLNRMLLGRKTLEGLFLVDPGRCYLHGRKRRKPSASRTKSKKPPNSTLAGTSAS